MSRHVRRTAAAQVPETSTSANERAPGCRVLARIGGWQTKAGGETACRNGSREHPSDGKVKLFELNSGSVGRGSPSSACVTAIEKSFGTHGSVGARRKEHGGQEFRLSLGHGDEADPARGSCGGTFPTRPNKILGAQTGLLAVSRKTNDAEPERKNRPSESLAPGPRRRLVQPPRHFRCIRPRRRVPM